MSAYKSRDLGPDRSRCNDRECPLWDAGCARAEEWLGEMRFTWLPVGKRRKGATRCSRQIDPKTMREAGRNAPVE
nr:hypothetical protein [uncultured Pseudodesulfovibrio sp.]